MVLDILAIGAHPDDVELACAGTIAKSSLLGYKVGILDLTEGEMGTRGNRRIRASEAASAAKILGCVRENLHLPDSRFEVTRPNLKKLIGIIRRYRPRVLLIPHSSERHPDHVRAHHLAREARYYAGLKKLTTREGGTLQKEWRPPLCFHYMQWQMFTPTFIVDISDVYDTRMSAIMAHKSQFYNPSSREPDTVLSQKSFLVMLETRARFYGQQIGVRYGEPFFSTDTPGVDDMFDLKFLNG